MAMVALSLAACSAMLTVWTWRQTRDLSQSFKTLQERLEQVCMKVLLTLHRLLSVVIAFMSFVTLTFFEGFEECYATVLIIGYGKPRGGLWKNAKLTALPSLPAT